MAPSRVLVVSALLVATLGLTGTLSGAATAPRSRPFPSLETCRQLVRSETLTAGQLTVATNNPALAPWFVNDDPANKLGYESALTYKIASSLGFAAKTVSWYTEPFELAATAGAKPFDFDINEITYSKALAASVSLSSSYYNVNESLVALKTNGIVKRHTPKELRRYLFGALKGSPGLKFLRSVVKPLTAPVTYKTLADAVDALTAKHIAAIVIDTPSGQYLTSQQLPSAVQFAQFHTTGQYYAVVLQKGNQLVSCVNAAIKYLRKNGELDTLAKKYLTVYSAIPFISP
jgi:polar amino acid transport system substrate-binding protein